MKRRTSDPKLPQERGTSRPYATNLPHAPSPPAMRGIPRVGETYRDFFVRTGQGPDAATTHPPAAVPRKPAVTIPGATDWSEVRIRFVLGNAVVITVNGNKHKRDASQLGFIDGRTMRPDEQWELLGGFAKGGFVSAKGDRAPGKPASQHYQKNKAHLLDHDDLESCTVRGGGIDKKLQKRVQRLAAALRRIFGLKESPFAFDRHDKGWRLKGLTVLSE